MAYVATNPPAAVGSRIGSGPLIWVYTDADAHTDIDATDYFTNGSDLGMRVQDPMCVIDTATATITWHRITVVTAGGAATIGASAA